MEKLVRYGLIPVFVFVCCCLHDSEQRGSDSGSKGGWSDWGNFSGCSKTCGMGVQTRIRQWVPGQGEPPLEVPFTNTEQVACFPGSCPENGTWSEWGMWGQCTVACGEGGTRERHRDCNNPPPMFGGADCQGEKFDREDCNVRSCPAIPPNFNHTMCLDTETYFMCENNQMCVHKVKVCDGTLHCNDGTDEADERCWKKDFNLGHIRFTGNSASRSYNAVSGSCIGFVTAITSLLTLLM